MEVIDLILKDGTEKEFQIALVESPAIESDFMAFSKKELFRVVDEEKRIISGYAMVAEMPIYRRDDDGKEYYVKFTKDAIKDIVEKYFENRLTNQTNLNHESGNFVDGLYVFESFIIDEQRGIMQPKGYDNQADGSWFISMKVKNDKVWEQIKNGEFKGFSVEGRFDDNTNKFINEIDTIYKKYKKNL